MNINIINKVLLKAKTQLVKDKKIIMVSLMAGVAFTGVFAFTTKAYSDSIQDNIAQEVIRFHVRANSNSDEDQALKVDVKNNILATFSPELSKSQSKEETETYLQNNLENIRQCALDEIQRQGYDYDVNVYMTEEFFPTKTYGDVTLPPGDYEALRVDIGEAAGNNWWCVMFPPLCYVDITQQALDPSTKSDLENLVSEESYYLMSNEVDKENTEVKIKFKIVEMWQNKEHERKSEDQDQDQEQDQDENNNQTDVFAAKPSTDE